MRRTQLFSARRARRLQIVSVLQSPVHGVTPIPRVLKELNSWKSVSLEAKASVTLCQKAGFNDCEAGHPPMAGP